MEKPSSTSSAQGAAQQVTREDLYELVWREPMLRVAERHAVSSSFLARVCSVMNVPRPPRGYWAKLEFGKAGPQPALPEARPEDKLVWNRSNDPDIVARPLPKAPNAAPRFRKPAAALPPKRHALVTDVRDLYLKGRTNEAGFLKPSKRLLPDLVVSEKTLDTALEAAHQLFQQLELAGHRVVLAPTDRYYTRCEVDEREVPRQGYHHANLWSPQRPTFVYVGTVAIGLTLFEVTEEIEVKYVNGKYIPVADLPTEKRKRYASIHSWTTKRDYVTGRLCLQAFSPYGFATWKRQWRESGDKKLTNQFGRIVSELTDAAVEIARLVEEGERQAEIRRRQWEEERRQRQEQEELARQIRVRDEARKELMRAIDVWGEVKRLQAFFADAEMEARRLEPEQCERALTRIALARELIGEQDALGSLLIWKSPDER
ncbi:MAG: hypothetical protein MUC34_20645 [Anaerolineae bacterium]|jgi:hypothetical protein|nr:hypothetical protein [Anaerolineae bacterium]